MRFFYCNHYIAGNMKICCSLVLKSQATDDAEYVGI